ncbi:MAG: AbrB/MazE/SpoVT family DNA-binding domain-containing protein [Clostridiales bacterium]|jgi:AbrB family transcriptional regulator (stage V sporulation protein T)|nr:AbrB/MazE/SpoVT family DNA-binding domain-containing protein [Clostridiales bacterium]
MKATGIVRRIDELGRIVIPKEIRRTMHLKEGDEVEIFTDDKDLVMLKKFSPIKRVEEFSEEYAGALSEATGNLILVCDKDRIIAVAGEKKNIYFQKPLQNKLDRFFEARKALNLSGADVVSLTGEDTAEYKGQVIFPITLFGDILGAVVMISLKKKLDDSDMKLCAAAALFLSRQV